MSGTGIAPTGIEKANTGHHHLLVGTTLSADELKQPIAADAKHLDFGGSQTETMSTLPPGQHTATLIKLMGGAIYGAGERSVYLVLSGAGTVHNAAYRRLTAFHLRVGEAVETAARDETEVLRLVLPDLAGVAARTARIETGTINRG